MSPARSMSSRTRLMVALLALALLVPLVGSRADAQEDGRIGDDLDPVIGAVQLSTAAHADGMASHAVIGRDDVFVDNLAATALVGRFGTLLLTTGGADAQPRQEMLEELQRALGPGRCEVGGAPQVYLAGGDAAVSTAVEQAVAELGYCMRRLDGATRIDTAVAVADAVGDQSDTVVLVRDDDWADSAAIGSWAALTNSRILITPTDALDARTADALRRHAPTEILLLGGEAALSSAVEQAAAEIAPVRRIAGPARDATAVAIAEEVWGDDAGDGVAAGNGYAGTSWAYLFAAAPLAGEQSRPILYADDNGLTAASASWVQGERATVLAVGPAVPPDAAPGPTPEPPTGPDLAAADVALETVGSFAAPLTLRPRPDTGELWVGERAGVIRTVGAAQPRTVLDISSTVGTGGEGGLLGFDFSADGQTLYVSSTNRAGDSVIDAFAITGDSVDLASRRELIRVDQPASNHNGGDLHLGPDGYLWWSLGDGGGSNDDFDNGQDPFTLLGSLVRIAPTADGYDIPPDNPFADGQGGAPEVWAYGLRNPYRFSFDDATGDLYIGDVGQGAVEEIDWLAAGTGAGSNFGWPVFEGTQAGPGGGSAPGHVPPVFEYPRSGGNCSVTGGVVYRGTAIPELAGAYVFADFCRGDVRAILVQDGDVTQIADLGIDIDSPVGFGVDHSGEVYVLGIGGTVAKVVPA